MRDIDMANRGRARVRYGQGSGYERLGDPLGQARLRHQRARGSHRGAHLAVRIPGRHDVAATRPASSRDSTEVPQAQDGDPHRASHCASRRRAQLRIAVSPSDSAVQPRECALARSNRTIGTSPGQPRLPPV